MESTVVFVSLFLGLLVATFALWAVFLRLGLRWAKVQEVTWHRVGRAMLLVLALQTPIWIASHLLHTVDETRSIVLSVATSVAAVLVACTVMAEDNQDPLASVRASLAPDADSFRCGRSLCHLCLTICFRKHS